MRASQVLQKCLPNSLSAMHVLRMRALLSAVQALIVGRRLTLTDIARAWPGAERVRAPLKAFDRLLGNRHLHGERGAIEADMARWLLRGPQPVILIDWSDLKPDKSWCLLRAAVPVGGRTLTLLDTIVRGKEQGSAEAERHFLQQLRKLIPEGVTPILVTDAGFRTPWFRAVSALGWHWVGRLRGATRIKLQEAPTIRNTGMTAAPCTPGPGPRHASSHQRWSTAVRRWPAAWWCVPKRVRAAKNPPAVLHSRPLVRR